MMAIPRSAFLIASMSPAVRIDGPQILSHRRAQCRVSTSKPHLTTRTFSTLMRMHMRIRIGCLTPPQSALRGIFFVSCTKPPGQIYLHGACVTSWKQASGDEVLYVRPDAKFDKSKPISGGIPHCFPQVGVCFEAKKGKCDKPDALCMMLAVDVVHCTPAC